MAPVCKSVRLTSQVEAIWLGPEMPTCDVQDLQKRSWQPEQADSRPSTSASLAEEERACRHLSAQVENAVLPKMGSIVARANRLFSQASVALGDWSRLP